jgi:hypothetical protein
MTEHVAEEGWYTDPYGRHEARWLSDGAPTKLVRDDGVTSYDEPPDEPPTQAATRIEVDPAPSHGADLLRADAAEAGDQTFDASRATLAEFDALGQWGAPNVERLLDGEEY